MADGKVIPDEIYYIKGIVTWPQQVVYVKNWHTLLPAYTQVYEHRAK